MSNINHSTVSVTFIKMHIVVACLFCVLVYVAVTNGDDIKCYDCDFTDDDCRDPFKADHVNTISCAGSCTKLKATSGVLEGKAQRGCSPVKAPKAECQSTEVQGNKVTGCTCDGNLCNGGNMQTTPGLLMIVASACVILWQCMSIL